MDEYPSWIYLGISKGLRNSFLHMQVSKINKKEENLLFLKQLIKNPRSLGAIAPSSPALGKFISKHLDHCRSHDSYIVEIGAGTGRLTRSLLESGINPNNIIVVEIDPIMAEYLRKILPPSLHVICGNAEDLENLLPSRVIGNVSAVVSGIPLINCRLSEQTRLVSSWKKILMKNGVIFQFTYGPMSPLPADRFGLVKKRLGHVFLNIPPATVWQYSIKTKATIIKSSLRTKLKVFVNKEFRKNGNLK